MSIFTKEKPTCDEACPAGRNIDDCPGPYSLSLGALRVMGTVVICGEFRIPEVSEDELIHIEVEDGE